MHLPAHPHSKALLQMHLRSPQGFFHKVCFLPALYPLFSLLEVQKMDFLQRKLRNKHLLPPHLLPPVSSPEKC